MLGTGACGGLGIVAAAAGGCLRWCRGGIIYWLHGRVKPILVATERLSNHVQMFSEGLAVLERQNFKAAKLKAVQSAGRGACECGSGAGEAAEPGGRWCSSGRRRFFYVLSALLAAGTQAGMTLASWKRRNGAAMRGWLAAWGEFEALNALANYAFEHPEDAWPELLGDGTGSV